MKNILFRGKRTDNNEWVYGGYYLEPYTNNTYIVSWNSFCLGFVEHIKVDPQTLGQSTGLLDSDDVPIFEGDILIFGDVLLTVYWNGETFQWQAKKAVQYPHRRFPDENWDYIDLGWIAAEVPINGKMTTQIGGNIYDNASSFFIAEDEDTWKEIEF